VTKFHQGTGREKKIACSEGKGETCTNSIPERKRDRGEGGGKMGFPAGFGKTIGRI